MPGIPYRVRGRPTSGPNSQPMVPRDVVADVSNTVSVTGSVISNPTTSASFVTAQITITATATPIFAVSTSIFFREVTNPTGSNATVFIGGAGVTVTTGHFLPGAAAFDQQYNSAALFGIVATGSVTVSTIGW